MLQNVGVALTPDDTPIAYATLGVGRPVIYVTGWLSHLELSWALPTERAFYEELAQGTQLTRYDRDGTGLSTPASAAPSLEHEIEQLEAIAATTQHPFDLIGTSMGALIAVAYAAKHPEQVKHLVLYGGWATGADISPKTAQDYILGLVESHWGLGSDVLTEIFAPDANAATRKELSRYQRASSSSVTARDLLAMSYALDVSPLLGDVRAPTLVVHRAGDRAAPVEQAEVLAAGIPGAQLVVLPGRSHLPWVGDAHALVTVIRRFLGLKVARRGGRELTPRQEEVASLVAEGATNREIGEQLGIDERSAEGHVERIRVRLGFTSRAQIASWVASRL